MQTNGVSNFPPGPDNPFAAPLSPETTERIANAGSGNAAATFEKIKQSANSAYRKTIEILHKGRGRPRNDGSPKASDIVRSPENPVVEPAQPNIPANPENNPASVAPIFDAGLLAECVGGVVKGVLALPNGKLQAIAVRKGKSELEAAKLINNVAPTEKEIGALSKFAGILLEKYKVDTKFAPEFACGAILAGVGLRYMSAFKDFSRLPDAEKTT